METETRPKKCESAPVAYTENANAILLGVNGCHALMLLLTVACDSVTMATMPQNGLHRISGEKSRASSLTNTRYRPNPLVF